MEQGKCTHWYMLEPISLFAIQTIASMRLSLHALRCETERWGTSDGEWLTMHTLPWTSLRVWVSHYDRNFSHNDNVHAWLQHSLVKFLNIKSRYSLSHVLIREMWYFWFHSSYMTSENDNRIYISISTWLLISNCLNNWDVDHLLHLYFEKWRFEARLVLWGYFRKLLKIYGYSCKYPMHRGTDRSICLISCSLSYALCLCFWQKLSMRHKSLRPRSCSYIRDLYLLKIRVPLWIDIRVGHTLFIQTL